MSYLIPGPTHGNYGAYKVHGKMVPVIAQQKALECVPASIGLVLRLRKHPEASSMTPAMLREISQQYGGQSYRPAPRDVLAGYQPTPGTNTLANIMNATIPQQNKKWLGSNLPNAAEVLSQRFGYTDAIFLTDGDLLSVLRTSSAAHPIMVATFIENFGAHCIVVAGNYVNTKKGGREYFIISDPFFGVGELELYLEDTGGTARPIYIPKADKRGHFLNEYVSMRPAGQ
jgi:hypothetical protein